MVLKRGKTSLNDAGLDVVGARAAVGGGRALVEGPARRGRRLRSRDLLEGPAARARTRAPRARGRAGRPAGGRVGTRSRGFLRPRLCPCGAEGTRPGRRRAGPLPRYHPPWRSGGAGPSTRAVTAAGSTRRPRGVRALPAAQGDLRSGQHPRAHTVPGSLLAVLGATRPVHAVRCCQSARGVQPGSSGFRPVAGAATAKVTDSWARLVVCRAGCGISSPHRVAACGRPHVDMC